MTATQIYTANEAAWHAARKKGITASEIPIVMGLSPWSSPYALYHRKTGDLPEAEDTMSMALGRHLESFVADAFTERHPFAVWGDGRKLFAHPGRPWQLATPDRILTAGLTSYPVTDPLAVLECKTSATYEDWGDDGSDEIPVHYRCQVLWQMEVMGVTAGYVACLFLHSRKLRVYELAMDAEAEADLKLMREEAGRFLARLRDADPPDVDWRPATTETLKRLHPSVEDRAVEVGRMPVIRYRAACRAYKAAAERKQLAENRLRQLLGDGRRIVLRGSYIPDHRGVLVPEVVARRDVYDLPEKIIIRKASTVDRLVAVKPKEEGPQ